MPHLLWTPSDDRIRAAAMTAFRQMAQEASARSLPDYDALHDWSVSEPAAFWDSLARFEGLPFTHGAYEVLSSDPMPRTRWFEGAELSYARALLYPGAEPEGSGPGAEAGAGPGNEPHAASPRPDDGNRPAIIALTEAGDERRIDRAALRRAVGLVQAALRRSGVRPGDAVVAQAANLPETVALLLACNGMGVLFASCSPDFGAEAAAARFAQVRPKLLFAQSGYRYGGRGFDVRSNVATLVERLPTLRGVVTLPYPGMGDAPGGSFEPWSRWVAGASRAVGDPFEAPTARGRGAGGQAAPPAPETRAFPFDHPLYALFSSGTTGVPKAMVHRAGGVLLTHLKEHHLHGDVREGDVVFYFTTCGWMMWNWLVSALAVGATIVLYDGSPAYPDAGVLWRMAERLGVTFFGTSARFLHGQLAHGEVPGRHADLTSLRTVASTGSPLSPAGFRFVYEKVGSDLHLASISGGTDIVSCFMLGVPTLPVYAGEIQRPGLGVDLAVFDEEGEDVVGRPGELVCRAPLPSMPLRFLGDPEQKRYHDAYFATYPGVWRHGDLVERTPRGGIVVLGRSDATLNPGGVRIGTAEIYRPLEQVPQVEEAVAVGRRAGSDEETWLLVVLAPDTHLSAELEARIRDVVRRGASPRHVPTRILQVPDLPRTRSGKTMEIAVRQLVNDEDVPNRAAAANPDALDAIRRVLAAARPS